jgi:hypothetical protein
MPGPISSDAAPGDTWTEFNPNHLTGPEETALDELDDEREVETEVVYEPPADAIYREDDYTGNVKEL